MAGWGPFFCSIQPKLDSTRATCDAPAKRFRECICHQTRMWHIYSTELNVCGERMVNLLSLAVSHQQRTELDGSSMPRNQGNSEPGTVQVWRTLQAMG